MTHDTHAVRLPLVPGGPPVLAVERLRAGARTSASRGAAQVLFCGGFHSTMHGDKARAVAAHCARRGLACTRFDYRGHGLSDGAAVELTLHDWLDDTLAVVDAASDAAPLVIVGSSMGAWLAVHATLRRPARVTALVLVAAAPDFLQDTLPARLEPTARERLARGHEVRLQTPYEPSGWPITAALIDSGRALALLTGDGARALRCPVRMLHGTDDDTAPWRRAAALLERLGSADATLALVKGGDHRLSTPRELARLTGVIDELTGIATNGRGERSEDGRGGDGRCGDGDSGGQGVGAGNPFSD